MIKKRIEQIKKRISWLKTEITMGNYYDGWTLSGLKKELKELVQELKVIKFSKNKS